eukprot:755746-Hanusia_phi.AAC.1
MNVLLEGEEKARERAKVPGTSCLPGCNAGMACIVVIPALPKVRKALDADANNHLQVRISIRG